ncbi:MAG TPA: fibronectin type III domain-containing protein [Cyclobacteriaceae bacterium]
MLLIVLLTSLKGVSQVYPVQATLQITPPYPLSLAAYVMPGSERMALNVYLADVNRPDLSVRLRLRIEGSGIRIETKQEFLPAPMTIHGGVPLRLIGADLADYFDPRNLNFSGITQREYEQKAALPEGLYQFVFEVIEYNRGAKISNSATVMSWLILNDPPLINAPRENEKIRIQSPQQVIFQWTPRHTGSPNSAFTTEYEFQLVEVWPATRNPNDAILTSPVIFETTTQSSTLIYGPAETALEPGRRYAFRIKAKSIVGVDELNLFKNDGYSQVGTFVYGDACSLPTGIRAESTSSSRADVYWDTQDNHTGYMVNYRLANSPNAVWYTNTSTVNDIEINSLKPGTTYEYQVAATCGFFESTFSPIATITTKEAPPVNYACGVPLQPFNLDPSALVALLKPGDIVYSGDFDVELTKVSGSNGSFSGEGIVVMPFMNNVKVKVVFTTILVSKELRMVQGFMDVKGAVLDIIPDQLTEMMDELTTALDDIDEGLDKTQEIVDKVDDILAQAEKIKNEMVSYLPYEFVQKIKDSQVGVASAKEALKSAATPEAEAAAKVQLREAKAKMKDAVGQALEYYAKMVKDILKIIYESLKELKAESQLSSSKTDYETAQKEVDKYLPEGYNKDADTQSEVMIIHKEEKSDGIPSEETKNFSDKAKIFYDNQQKYLIAESLLAFIEYYSKDGNLKRLADDFKIEGTGLLKLIGMKLKEGKTETEIKEQVKSEIKNKVELFISNKASGK